MEPEKLIELRFLERDTAFSNEVRAFLRRQAANGGVGLSGNVISGGYDILVREFKGSVGVISKGFEDCLVDKKSRMATKNIATKSKAILESRKAVLENLYKKGMVGIIRGNNIDQYEKYFHLDAVIELQKNELLVSVNKVAQEYQNNIGKTLLEKVKNEFMNRPIVVITVITIITVSTLLGFGKAIGFSRG